MAPISKMKHGRRLPSACAGLFAAADQARIAFERTLAAIDSVALTCREHAYQHANGRQPEMTAAYRAGISIAGMVQTLTRSVGANAVRDFATGAQLLNEVSEGRAALGPGGVNACVPRAF